MDTTNLAVEIPNPDAWIRSMQATGVVILLLGGAGVALLIQYPDAVPPWVWPVAVVGPLLLILVSYFQGPFFWRTARLRRVGGTVQGAPGGPLPAGQGRIVIERKLRASEYDTFYLYFVRYEGRGRTRTLYKRGFHPTVVRACAEGLCRLGGWEMVWRSDAGDEVRGPAELDQPLLARLAAEAAQPGDDRRPRAQVATTTGPGGSLQIDSGHLRPLAYGVSFVAVTAAFAIFGGDPLAFTWAALRRPVLVGAGFVVLLLLRDLLLAFPVEVSPRGVRIRTVLLGLTLRDRFLPADRLESLYVESAKRYHRLVFAGDGIHRAAGRYRDLEQATAARRAAARALLGR